MTSSELVDASLGFSVFFISISGKYLVTNYKKWAKSMENFVGNITSSENLGNLSRTNCHGFKYGEVKLTENLKNLNTKFADNYGYILCKNDVK